MKQILGRIEWEKYHTELTTHLGNLVRINTVNPPGNELEAARYLADLFEKENIESTILESAPGRGNIVARIKGDGTGKPLLLMSHLDVVGVETEKWKHDPFSAEIAEGCMWGRGTLDCKNSVALWAMILLILKRENITPKRDVVFLGAADEETGGQFGAKWLVENHFDLIQAEAALNEGGGFGLDFLDKTYYTYQTAEKGNIWLRFTASGTAGHASTPKADNPVLRITDLVSRLSKLKLGFSVVETVRRMVRTIASTQGFATGLVMKQLLNRHLSEWVISSAIKDESAGNSFRAMLNNTLCPTVLKAGHKVNVIPSSASMEIDIRVLPGQDPDGILEQIKRRAGSGFDIETIDLVPPSESPLDHPLADSIKKVVARHQPDSFTVPLLLPGTSDGAFLRSKGVVVYGFTPVLPSDDMDLAHNHDERISLESIKFGLEVGLETVLDFVL
ncbi:MAG: M20/M25/M40 family metallo-hydrolase [Proteobacteria bacterium]|nr:M20/M25/M40 family metallo-hydrolase [Pseudomonadota bacterium]